MSRTFCQKVEAEINRKEAARIKEASMKERIKCEESKKIILEIFDKVLEENLQKFEKYSSHSITSYDIKYIYKFREVVAELGFNFEFIQKLHIGDPDTYKLSVPDFKKGNRRTPAQLKLFKFNQDLAKAQKERKGQLLIECNRIKQCINEGSFDYAIKPNKRLWVVSQEQLNTSFEKDVVISFFFRLKLRFDGKFDDNSWIFTLIRND